MNVYKIDVNKKNEYEIEKIGELDKKLIFKPDVNTKFKLYQSSNVVFGELHPHLRDSAPDNWGRRVLAKIFNLDVFDSTDYDFLKTSNFDRVGNLYFTDFDEEFVLKQLEKEDKIQSSLDLSCLKDISDMEMLLKNEIKEENLNIQAFQHGTSIGGARPKAVIEYAGKRVLAKLSSSTDLFPMVRVEQLGLKLAKACGLNVCQSQLLEFSGKEILLIDRFDREKVGNKFKRKSLVSALTVLGLDEMSARYASYLDLAEKLKQEDKEELYYRMVFNVLIGNTDDHARNHCFFWHNNELSLTPCYDIVPFPRNTFETTHAMINGYNEKGKESSLSCLLNLIHEKTLKHFNLKNQQDVINKIQKMIDDIIYYYPFFCEEVKIKEDLLLNKAILNPSIFYGSEHIFQNPLDKNSMDKLVDIKMKNNERKIFIF